MYDEQVSESQNREADVAALLAELKQQASLPLESAMTLAPGTYRSAGFLALEIEHIFRREWICVGRIDEIPNPGDWFSFDLVGEPLLIVRNEQGEVRAMSNVCAHRWARLKTGRGHAEQLRCPFHAWTYDLSGCLRGAPFMTKAKDFNPHDIRLPEFRLEIWLGFIFVNLDPDATPLAPRLTGLEEQLKAYPVVEQKTLSHVSETWDANWKLALENAMESYHVFGVHPKTLDPFLPTKTVTILPGEAGYNIHTMKSTLAPKAKSTFLRATIYPTLVIDVGHIDRMRLSWQTFMPLGVQSSCIRTGAAAMPGAAGLLKDPGEGNDMANAEDRPVVESAQRGLQASRARRGRISHLEAPIWEFTRYLSARLCSDRSV
jgi:choline monooxygenase